MRTIASAIALGVTCLAPSIAGACDHCKNGYLFGPPSPVGNGMAWSWVRYDTATKKPAAVGFSFTETAIHGLATELPKENPMRAMETELPLPRGVKDLPFDHITLDWNPKGHIPPGIYDVPHFDAHFYMIKPSERTKMTASEADIRKSLVFPAARFMPAGHVVPPLPSPGTYEPLMGTHWIDPASGEFRGLPFATTFIYGTFNGRMLFYEPMFSIAFLQSKAEAKAALKAPEAVQKSGYYPSEWKISFNPDRKEYSVSLEGLSYRKAS